jgi:hypothetical protein
MRPRAMASLASLRPEPLHAAIAEGLALIAEHVASLEEVAAMQEGPAAARATEILRVVSDEEAGKFLILLDVVRAGSADAKTKADQLKKAGNHIAKGVYSRAVDIRPADFAELLRFAKDMRVSHYLDGPNDVDWIFRNRIEAEREEKLYVDYVASDDGDTWVSPRVYEDIGPMYPSGAVELVLAMQRAGFCDARVLSEIARVWRDFHPVPETRWSQCRALNIATVERILAEAVVGDLSEGDIARIVETWLFPLYEVDLRKIDVDIDELREQQRNWHPDIGLYDDYYD